MRQSGLPPANCPYRITDAPAALIRARCHRSQILRQPPDYVRLIGDAILAHWCIQYTVSADREESRQTSLTSSLGICRSRFILNVRAEQAWTRLL